MYVFLSLYVAETFASGFVLSGVLMPDAGVLAAGVCLKEKGRFLVCAVQGRLVSQASVALFKHSFHFSYLSVGVGCLQLYRDALSQADVKPEKAQLIDYRLLSFSKGPVGV